MIVREQALENTTQTASHRHHELTRAYLDDGKILGTVRILQGVVQHWESLDKSTQSRLEFQRVLGYAFERNGEHNKAGKDVWHACRVGVAIRLSTQ